MTTSTDAQLRYALGVAVKALQQAQFVYETPGAAPDMSLAWHDSLSTTLLQSLARMEELTAALTQERGI